MAANDIDQKKFKHRSGKTMRYIKGQATHGSMTTFTGQFGILKSTVGTLDASKSKDFEKIVQDGGLELTGNHEWWNLPVTYSLNKKKRWLLPDMIADGIADEEFHKDSDYNVVMVEREIPCFKEHRETSRLLDQLVLRTGKASCKAVHRSQGEEANCRRAKKNCSYEGDLVRNPKTIRNRREEKKERRRERARTGRRIDIPSQTRAENVPSLPELRYEVLRPTPINRSMTHTICKKTLYDEDYHERKRKLSGQKKDNFGKLQLDTDLCDEIHFDLDEEEEWPIHTGDQEECLYRYDGDTPAFDLGSYIKTYQPTEFGTRNHQESYKTGKDEAKVESSRALTSPCRKQYGKGCAIFRPDLATPEPEQGLSKSDLSDVDTSDSGFDSDGSSTNHTDHKVSWLHLGSVAKEGVLPERLRMDFGHDYAEGRSVPRRFSIKLKAVSDSGVPVGASAVFATDDVRQDPGMVNLRLRCCSADFPMQDLHQAVRERISTPPLVKMSLMEQLKESLSCYADSQEGVGSKICKPKKPEVTLDTVQSMMGWTFNYDTAENVRAQLDDEEAQEDSTATSDGFSNAIPDGEDSCGICFETLAPSGGEDEEMGTALLGCGHLFCNDCWIRHVTNRVMMGETSIRCPAFKCESVLDKVTLLSLLPDSLVRIHLAHLHDNRINNHPEWKWCPNPKCGRLVQVRDVAWTEPGGDLSGGPRVRERLLGLPVPCECGVSWCSECKEVAHWPATCKQAEQYHQYMKETGVDHVRSEHIRSVEVKRCPSCRNPMQKNGGCMHMMCNCGANFCWECLGPWIDHINWDDWDYRCLQGKDNLETVLLSLKKNVSIFFTELALENHKMRGRQTVMKHHQQASRLAKRMFFVPEATSHLILDDLLLQGVPGVQDLVPWSYSSSQDDQSRLISLITRATKMAAFAAEVHLLLEYMSTLIGHLPRKQRIGKNAWKLIICRLMFIACRMEELLERQHEKPAETVWRSLTVLLHQGQLCIKDITRTMPLLHKGLQNVNGEGSKRTAEGNSQGARN
ncbi:uncharacterized protein LOC129281146 isoform X2 [Lytechinus pictus]|uniref:uncharacterized protein LOC129281146 isoform X2 n=1 Tax=Lytechinus pictus TaxID=7653 RepID=UPI0030BA19D9